ncbi:MAG: GNAT family N-acetyltransferase [Alphaproteobacteria bacterium]|nr:GNAT family N-acetyltransferase [Alphaproteobacteria bacterium]
MSANIRAAIASDAAAIISFIAELAEFEKLGDEVQVTEADIVRDLFSDTPRVFCEIIEWDGEAVGFGLWYYTYSTFRGRHGIWLEDLFIEQEFRGRGLGKKLMAHMAGKCVTNGLGRLEWWVLDWNRPAIDFYRSFGAKLMAEWTVCRLDGIELAALATHEP